MFAQARCVGRWPRRYIYFDWLSRISEALAIASCCNFAAARPLHLENHACGLRLAVQLVRRLRKGGTVMMAPVCSTWTFMNRSTSKRTKVDPTGDTSLPSVRTGNLLFSRVVLLAMLVLWREGTYIIENPMSSLLPYHPRFAQLFSKFRACTSMLAGRDKHTWKPNQTVRCRPACTPVFNPSVVFVIV